MADKDEKDAPVVSEAQHTDEYSADKTESERQEKAPDYKPTP